MENFTNFLKCFAMVAALLMFNCEALENIVQQQAILRKSLIGDGRYDRFDFPPEMISKNESLRILTKLHILHIYDLEEITGTLTVNGRCLSIWSDSRLKWKLSDYPKIKYINVPRNSIWTPEITLYNNADTINVGSAMGTILLITYSGYAISMNPISLKSTCPIDHRLYPFDEHVCNISLGSWTHLTNDKFKLKSFVNLATEEELMKAFRTEHPQWKILEQKQTVENKSVGGPEVETVGRLLVTQLRLRREAPLFKFMLITPGILAMILTLASFWLSPASEIKLTINAIAIGIQLALMLMLAQKIPSGGQHIPAIVLLLGSSFILSSLSLTISVIVIKVTHPDNACLIPECLKKLLNGTVGRLLCLKQRSTTTPPPGFMSRKRKEDEGEAQLLETDIGEIENNIIGEENEPPVEIKNDWLVVGFAVDRCCFILYCCIFLIICISTVA